MTQKQLIQAVGAFLEAGRANGSIRDVSATGAPRVYYGYASKHGQGIPFGSYPYIILDDGGERTEIVTYNTQKKIYTIEVEMMTHFTSNEDPLIDILDFSEQVKSVFELRENRLMEGLTFGLTITPLLFADEQENFYRGRSVTVQYHELEQIFEQF